MSICCPLNSSVSCFFLVVWIFFNFFSESGMHIGRKKMKVVIVLISILASVVTFLGMTVAFKYWQKKREQDQARFLKLFEDGDDVEDELGPGTVL